MPAASALASRLTECRHLCRNPARIPGSVLAVSVSEGRVPAPESGFLVARTPPDTHSWRCGRRRTLENYTRHQNDTTGKIVSGVPLDWPAPRSHLKISPACHSNWSLVSSSDRHRVRHVSRHDLVRFSVSAWTPHPGCTDRSCVRNPTQEPHPSKLSLVESTRAQHIASVNGENHCFQHPL